MEAVATVVAAARVEVADLQEVVKAVVATGPAEEVNVNFLPHHTESDPRRTGGDHCFYKHLTEQALTLILIVETFYQFGLAQCW
jgi:hypothetical protein